MLTIDCQHLQIKDRSRARCHHPGLIQLGELTADICKGCLFQEPKNGSVTERQEQLSQGPLNPFMSVPRVIDELRLPPRDQPVGWWKWENTQQAFHQLADEAIDQFVDRSAHWNGRGIVVVGGGKYLVCAYVTIRVLRHVGCQLPIELWHLDDEVDAAMEGMLSELGVVCCNAEQHHRDTRSTFRFLPTWWKGWQLKSYAIQHSRFAELLLLDADSYPTRDPSYLFDLDPFRNTGAIFWPDTYTPEPSVKVRVGKAFGFQIDDGIWSESGQLMINKIFRQRETMLALHYNSYADFSYRIVYGDKDTFPLAWRRLNSSFGRLWPRCGHAPKTLLQMDERGQPLFQHRIHDKFRFVADRFDSTRQLTPGNSFIPQLQHEVFCMKVLNELRSIWKPTKNAV